MQKRNWAILTLLLSTCLVGGCRNGASTLPPTSVRLNTLRTATVTSQPPTSTPTIRPTRTPTDQPSPTATLSYNGYPLVSMAEWEELIDARIKDFEGTLSLTLEITAVTIEASQAVFLQYNYTFINITSHPMVVSYPRLRTTFASGIFAMEFGIRTMAGDYIRLGPTLFVENDDFFFPEYITLGAGETISNHCDRAISFAFNENIDDWDVLPPGIYEAYLTYSNANFGDLVRVDDELYDADMNAWVGELESNKVQFEMPDLKGMGMTPTNPVYFECEE